MDYNINLSEDALMSSPTMKEIYKKADLLAQTMKIHRKLIQSDGVVGAEGHGAFDDMLKLPNIAGPGVVGKQVQDIGSQVFVGMILIIKVVQEKGGKGQNIIPALS